MNSKPAGAVPDPTRVLPDDGVTAVLIQAAFSNPIIALLLVTIIICFAWWASCQVLIKWKQFDVMKSPEAAKAMVELSKLDKTHKRAIAKLQKPEAAKPKGGKPKGGKPHGGKNA